VNNQKGHLFVQVSFFLVAEFSVPLGAMSHCASKNALFALLATSPYTGLFQ